MKSKSLKEIADFVAAELCRRVGALCPHPDALKYEVDDYEWTHAEEDDFRNWLEEYLKTVQPFKRMGKKDRAREIDWLIFQYSWKYKEE